LPFVGRHAVGRPNEKWVLFVSWVAGLKHPTESKAYALKAS
jgi:hypothetical protein